MIEVGEHPGAKTVATISLMITIMDFLASYKSRDTTKKQCVDSQVTYQNCNS